MLDKVTTYNLLYDFYRPLLTEKQQTFMELYYAEDWSLGEIAAHYSISRQAVHDRVKRVEKALTEFEAALHLLDKHQRRKKLIAEIEQHLHAHAEIGKTKRLLKQLLEID